MIMKNQATLVSAGVKYKQQEDADKSFDARTIRENPHNYPAYRRLTGLDAQVRDMLDRSVEAQNFVTRVIHFIRKSSCEVKAVVYCHGGRHRSVYVVETSAKRLRKLGYEVNVIHRDIGK